MDRKGTGANMRAIMGGDEDYAPPTHNGNAGYGNTGKGYNILTGN